MKKLLVIPAVCLLSVGSLKADPIGLLDLMDDSYSTPFETELVVAAPGVFFNDTIPIGLAIVGVGAPDPAQGTLSAFNDLTGAFTFMPALGFSGEATFTYDMRLFPISPIPVNLGGVSAAFDEVMFDVATVKITVHPESCEVPDGGATLTLLGLGLAGVAVIRRRS